jgi:hypothetical protein
LLGVLWTTVTGAEADSRMATGRGEGPSWRDPPAPVRQTDGGHRVDVGQPPGATVGVTLALSRPLGVSRRRSPSWRRRAIRGEASHGHVWTRRCPHETLGSCRVNVTVWAQVRAAINADSRMSRAGQPRGPDRFQVSASRGAGCGRVRVAVGFGSRACASRGARMYRHVPVGMRWVHVRRYSAGAMNPAWTTPSRKGRGARHDDAMHPRNYGKEPSEHGPTR